MSGKYKYLFGPVPSRRFGRSLGIDVTPFKTCSFDCVFCQCGCTTQLVSSRDEFVPFEAVCDELRRWLKEDGQADCITFAGSGEPTLYSRLGELIDFIKANTTIPVIVLSNGTLLHRPAVRGDLLRADIVKVSLSAWDDASFQKINRPVSGLTFEQLLSGEREFRSIFRGELWLEVFLMKDINDSAEQVVRIAAAAAEIRPDKIHLNTAVRPPAEAEAQPVSKEKLDAFCGFFRPRAEVVASFSAAAETTARPDVEKLVGLLSRHPATAAQLAQMYGVEAALIIPLLSDPRLQTEMRGGETYYKCR